MFKPNYRQEKNIAITLLIVLLIITSYRMLERSSEVIDLKSELDAANQLIELQEDSLSIKNDRYDTLSNNYSELKRQLDLIEYSISVPVYIDGEEKMKVVYSAGQSMLDCQVGLNNIASELGYYVLYDTDKGIIKIKESLEITN